MPGGAPSVVAMSAETMQPRDSGPEVAGPGRALGWALAALSLSMLLASLGTSVANVALPTLEEDFGASFGQVQWVVLAYLLALTTLVVSAGRLGDLVGRRRLLLAGLAVFTAASALCAAAPSLTLLIAARAAQGAGAALMMALTLAFVAETVPAARTGTAMGLLGTTSAIGTALGPSLGGALIAGLGWRAIFLVNVPLGLLALVLAHRHLPGERRRAGSARPRFDVVGTLLLALTLGAYSLAMTIGHGRLGPLERGAPRDRGRRGGGVRRRRGARERAARAGGDAPRPRPARRARDERAGLDRDDGDPRRRALLPVPGPRPGRGARRAS